MHAPRPVWWPRRTAAALLAASAAQAQPCIWAEYTTSSGSPSFAVYDTSVHRVLFGFRQFNPASISAWDGAAWTQVSTAGPGNLSSTAAAYDSARGRLVLFGGYRAGAPFAETWEWDGAAWARVFIPGPEGRFGHAMVYDQARQRTVLFGGAGGTLAAPVYLGDTWEYDGTLWTHVAVTGPAARMPLALAYDSQRARTLLYGGLNPSRFADLWEWDGAAWLQRSADPPPGVNVTWMAFDPSRARLILGAGLVSASSSTWELDPGALDWTPREPNLSPLGPAAFDPDRSVAVVSGGNRTWEYQGTASGIYPRITQQPVGGNFPLGATITLTVQATGTNLSYQWRRWQSPLSNGGNISGVTTPTLTIENAQNANGDPYDVLVWNCSTVTSGTAYVSVNIGCYANCDASTAVPYLNVADFTCFLQKFAGVDPYANCDGSCHPICVSVADFTCFLQKFAGGCTAP